MRLIARLMIAGVALAAGGMTAGCSTAAVPDAQDAVNRPAAIAVSGSPSQAITATVPAASATKTAGGSAGPVSSVGPVGPVGPVIDVVGAPRGVKAKEGILVDATTGQVLWAKDASVARPIASITKVMTALVILQAGGLNRPITVPKAVVGYVAKYGAEAAGLIPGQVYTTDELLHAMLIVSAADAAYTLANAYGPGLPAFIAKMNAEAAKLGLVGTHFASPDGLPYPTEFSTYSTPADLVTLGKVAMQNPVFRSIVDLKYFNLAKGGGHPAASWSTSDELLLDNYPGVIGIKSGYTNAAGHTLLFQAIRNGRTLIGVVLGSPPTNPATGAKDAAKILTWGFALNKSG
jgi:serine-type D-Ala-D-Ala carboxypeptidase (penicillin-binding protein 5/6)